MKKTKPPFDSPTLSILLFLLTSCASPALDFNKNLIRPNSVDESQQIPFQPPYVCFYQKDNYKLTFISAFHEPGADSPTCKTIKKVFSQQPPSFLIVEGKEFKNVNDPVDLKRAQECAQNNMFNCEEGICAIIEAIKLNVLFAYGEPSERLIVSDLQKKGYAAKEIAFFYGVRQIPELKRQGLITTQKLKKNCRHDLKDTQKELGLKKCYLYKISSSFILRK